MVGKDRLEVQLYQVKVYNRDFRMIVFSHYGVSLCRETLTLVIDITAGVEGRSVSLKYIYIYMLLAAFGWNWLEWCPFGVNIFFSNFVLQEAFFGKILMDRSRESEMEPLMETVSDEDKFGGTSAVKSTLERDDNLTLGSPSHKTAEDSDREGHHIGEWGIRCCVGSRQCWFCKDNILVRSLS